MRQLNWTRILTILLVVLAAYAILFVTTSILFRFTQAILLFVMGAMVAYILTPIVNRLETALRARWLAIMVSYFLMAAALFAIAVLLFTPFVQQSQSLVDNLRNPSSASLRTITLLERDASRVHTALLNDKNIVSATQQIPTADMRVLTRDVNRLPHDITNIRHGTLSGLARAQHPRKGGTAARLPPNPPPQTTVPPSYVDPLATQVDELLVGFRQATADRTQVDFTAYTHAISRAAKLTAGAKHMYHVMSTNPIALIRSQSWLDEHGIRINVQEKFGQAASQVSNQGTYLLNNVITIVTETANILLNVALILIIAFYFLNDAGRIIHGGVDLIPARYREQVWFFISSLDKVVGGYIRGQLFLSALAGALGGAGAAALGVPYPLLIGIMTFLLESIPVIGPMIAVVPAALISLFFTPPLTTAALVVWFLIFQQIVTNIIGPRVNSMAVGIHPLEAILAVLVGYPLGGFLGAFLAVPVAGIIHIVIREFYAYFALGRSLPTAVVPPSPEDAEGPEPTLHPAMVKGRDGGRAVGEG